MTKSNIYRCAEGVVITAAGILFLALSIQIRNNPVQLAADGVLQVLVQAKFIPIALSVLITLQGISLTVSQWQGKEETKQDDGFTPRALIVCSVTIAYLILGSLLGFLIPTVIYIAVLLFICNKGKNPLMLLALTVLYSIIALVIIPTSLNLQLM